jgi:[ribosomal protein S5]-alanine N-acetyltransferase
VLELQLLRPDHLDAVRSFEVDNRAYFGRFINDRGDEFFATFPERHEALLAEALRDLCQRAADTHGLNRLKAETSRANVASQRVLEKAGFAVEGTCVVAGEPGIEFGLPLRAEASDE